MSKTHNVLFLKLINTRIIKDIKGW